MEYELRHARLVATKREESNQFYGRVWCFGVYIVFSLFCGESLGFFRNRFLFCCFLRESIPQLVARGAGLQSLLGGVCRRSTIDH